MHTLSIVSVLLVTLAAGSEAEFHKGELIFPLEPVHNHGSCIVECPNGDLLVSWFRGGERREDCTLVLGAHHPGEYLGKRADETLLRPPEAGHEQHDNHVDLQTPDHHQPDEKRFRVPVEVCIVLSRPHHAVARADIV